MFAGDDVQDDQPGVKFVRFQSLVERLRPIYWDKPRNFAAALRSTIEGDTKVRKVTYLDVDEAWLKSLEASSHEGDPATRAFDLNIDVPLVEGVPASQRREEISKRMMAVLKVDSRVSKKTVTKLERRKEVARALGIEVVLPPLPLAPTTEPKRRSWTSQG